MYRLFFLTSFYLICYRSSYAQVFGGHPDTTQWWQLDTDTVRVVFHKGLFKQANRIVKIEHQLAKDASNTLGDKFRKVEIVLQNRTVQSNGYVGLAPFRSEFFIMPSANVYLLGSTAWLDLLALHEYRHVQQEVNFNRGWNKALYYLSGQLGWAMGSHLAVPNWFFEGDAVGNETRYSLQGRGRLPAFYDDYRALFGSNTIYSYAKTRNGSLKDFVPDHYRLGYLMCQYALLHHGSDVWKKTTQNTFRRIPFYPFSRALKKYTGLTTKQLYKQTIQSFNLTCLQLASGAKKKDRILSDTNRSVYTSYNFPHQFANGNIAALKRSYKELPALVTIDSNKKERVVAYQGFSEHEYISYENQYALWVENTYDARWGWRRYSDIVVVDINKSFKRRLTHKASVFFPRLSPSELEVAAVEVNQNQEFNLVLIDFKTGKEKRRIKSEQHLSFLHWTHGSDSLLAVSRREDGFCAIVKIDTKTANLDTLVPYHNQPIGQFAYNGSHIVYTAAYEGYNQLYAYELRTKLIYSLTNYLTGSYDPAFSRLKDAVLYTNFTSMGNRLFQTPFVYGHLVSLKGLQDTTVTSEKSLSLLDSMGSFRRTPTKYKQLHHLLNFHSWGIRAAQPIYSMYIASTNVLNNLVLEVTGDYNTNESKFRQTALLTYAGWYPIVDLGYQHANRDYYINRSTARLHFQESKTYGGVSVPFNFTQGIYSRLLQPSFNYSYRSLFVNDKKKASLQSLEMGLAFYQARRKALQHIYSRFGQYLRLQYQKALDRSHTYQLHLASELSFPGIWANHVLTLQSDFLKEGTGSFYRYQDLFVYPKGYGRVNRDKIVRTGLNYHFPLFYPDLGFAGLLYFKRVRANLFADFAKTFETNKGNANYNSAGSEIIFDVQFLNTPVLYSFFIRYSYLFNQLVSTDGYENGVVEIGIPLVRIQ